MKEPTPAALSSATPPWMLVRVALETSRHHQSADEDRLAALELTTLDDYRAFLARICGFEAAVEAAIARISDLEPSFVRERQKAALLQQDLRALGMPAESITTLPQPSTLTIRSGAQALGWMFVLERQTLLAGQIRRHLLRTLGEPVEPACSYFGAYGETPGAKFRAFGAALCAYAHLHAPSAIVAAANEAFRAQRQWYRSSARESSPRIAI